MIETFWEEKKIIKKIIIIVLFIFIFNFTFTHLGNNIVFAAPDGSATVTTADTEYELSDGGGKLLLPIHQLVLWVTDAFLELCQKSFYSPKPIIQKAKSEDLEQSNTGAFVLCVVAVIICAVAIVYTAGAAAGAVGAIQAAGAAASTTVGAVSAGLATASTMAGNIVRRPCYSWSIWSGSVQSG